MGGRGSSSRVTGGTSRISVPDKKQRPRGRSRKLRGEAGNPGGEDRPLFRPPKEPADRK